jgi:hypothetical protein
MIVCTVSLGKYSIDLAGIAIRRVDCTRLVVLRGNQFQKFLSEVRSVYEVVTCYCVVRWLSRSAVLSIHFHLPTDVRCICFIGGGGVGNS